MNGEYYGVQWYDDEAEADDCDVHGDDIREKLYDNVDLGFWDIVQPDRRSEYTGGAVPFNAGALTIVALDRLLDIVWSQDILRFI